MSKERRIGLILMIIGIVLLAISLVVVSTVSYYADTSALPEVFRGFGMMIPLAVAGGIFLKKGLDLLIPNKKEE
ncbi:hypothetical protein LJC17_04635 [Acholeplasma sp. OttesenSCG-928-E16]|nr:hypothetical protein [Acholeplasma sp. OttesenSCG-928-E16]